MKRTDADNKRWAKKYNWWWRNSNHEWNFDGVDYTTSLKDSESKWKDGRERAAWCYELSRRRIRVSRMKPFIELDQDNQGDVELAFAGEREIVRPHIPPDCGIIWEPELWFCISDKEWNLWAPNKLLSAEFIKVIEHERKDRGTRQPRDRDWKKGKSPSWLWPELIDLKDREKLADGFLETDRKLYNRAKISAEILAKWWDEWIVFTYEL